MNISQFKNNPPTVEHLRKAGFKVSVKHMRPILEKDEAELIPHLPPRTACKFLKSRERKLSDIREYMAQDYIWPRGGETVVVAERGEFKFSANSRCSVLDGYNRKYGIQRCLWRIVADMSRAGVE